MGEASFTLGLGRAVGVSTYLGEGRKDCSGLIPETLKLSALDSSEVKLSALELGAWSCDRRVYRYIHPAQALFPSSGLLTPSRCHRHTTIRTQNISITPEVFPPAGMFLKDLGERKHHPFAAVAPCRVNGGKPGSLTSAPFQEVVATTVY